MIEITRDNITLRQVLDSDKFKIAEYCNNQKISGMLRDIVPYPYTLKDADDFIELCKKENPQTTFAISYKKEFAGVIGLTLQTDIYRLSAEIGYWLAEPFWGKGIMTNAVQIVVNYGFYKLGLIRIFSGVLDANNASQRVMEKAGFKLDCIFEKAIIKNDKIYDEYRYSIVKEQ